MKQKIVGSKNGMVKNNMLVDSFNRKINYVRLSITDRCDFRCVYCMPENMTFLPRSEILSIEELTFLARAFSELGVSKIRITGGEPLIRRGVNRLVESIGELDEIQQLCVTTNGSRLLDHADFFKAAGVTNINVSLDTINPLRFKALTRHGDLSKVLAGLERTKALNFERIKLNAVVLKNTNLNDIKTLAQFGLEHGFDISFIEEMPLGHVSSHSRSQEFMSSAQLREILSTQFDLSLSDTSSGGPSRYWDVKGFTNKIGFISPHSENFCASCNRVRVTSTGRLLLCLGNEHSVDLRAVLRNYPNDMNQLKHAIIDGIINKPEKHEFSLDQPPEIVRFMNATGG